MSDNNIEIGRDERSVLYVVAAAYNEEAVIAETVKEVTAYFPNVIVVDDGSRDGTAGRAREAGATVLRHPINLGQGAALQTGITYAIQQNARYIATFDADGQHDPRDLPQMLDALQSQDVDIALGSRFLGQATGMPRRRRLFLRTALLFSNLTTGVKLTDTHNGLRLMTRETAQRIRITQNGMAHASEFIEQIRRLELRHVEVPVNIRYTPYSLAKGQNMSNALRVLTDLVSSKVLKW